MRLVQITTLAVALAGYASAGAIRPGDDNLSAQRGGGGVRGVSKRSNTAGCIEATEVDSVKMTGQQDGMNCLSKRQGSGTKDDPYIVRMGGQQSEEEASIMKRQGSGTKDDPYVVRMGGQQPGEKTSVMRRQGSGTKDDPYVVRMGGQQSGEGNSVEKRQSGTKDDPIIVRVKGFEHGDEDAQQ